MSRKLLNRFRCSNQSSGPKSQILLRAKLARFLGRGALAAAEPWGAPGPRRGAGGLVVVRPSLKRVVPGSVPPWRALCVESARALKAFFSILCVSRKFLNLFCCSNPRSGRPSCPRRGPGVADAGQPAVPAQLHEGHFHLLSVLASVPARFLPRALAFFSRPRSRLPGNVFRGRAVVFHFRQSKKRGGRSFSLGRL